VVDSICVIEKPDCEKLLSDWMMQSYMC
jgi:hypothetical protein